MMMMMMMMMMMTAAAAGCGDRRLMPGFHHSVAVLPFRS